MIAAKKLTRPGARRRKRKGASPRTQLLILSFIGALALGACDFREFDELSDQTWVDTTGSPGDLGASEYGTAIAFGGTSVYADGTAFLVAGARPDGVGKVAYLSDGTLETGGLIFSQLTTTADALPAAPPMAGDPRNPLGAVAAGIGENGGTTGRVLVINPDDLSVDTFVTTSPVQAVGFGHTTPADVGDLLALHGSDITVVGSYASDTPDAPVTCTVGREAGLAVLAANLDATAEEEIVVAAGDANGGSASVVHVMTTSHVIAGNGSDCFVPLTIDPLHTFSAPASEGDFGHAMAAGDFDGNGITDLAIAAPASNRVYVYMNLSLPAAPGAPIEVTATDSIAFGSSLAIADFDNDGNDELVVGDPAARGGDVASAGVVHLFQHDAGSFAVAATLHDAQPESGQRFGRAVAVARFAAAQDILVVGTAGEIFTYFRNPLSESDVRQ